MTVLSRAEVLLLFLSFLYCKIAIYLESTK
nr:MAG TPA: hypothetical protein [Caudoviricetes sp.]